MKTIDHDDTDYNYVTCSQLLHAIKSRGELLILRPSIYVYTHASCVYNSDQNTSHEPKRNCDWICKNRPNCHNSRNPVYCLTL